MLDVIQIWDQKFFLFLNHFYTSPGLDWFFLTVTDLQRNKPFVGASLVVLFSALIWKYKKSFWRPALYLIVAIGLTDLFCYRVLKKQIDRPRPFQTEAIKVEVRKIGHAHSRSFPSNHAANSFAGATALSYLFPQFSVFFVIYAVLVAFSRVYVGVHYPLDVIFGGLIGIAVSILIQRGFRNQIKPSTTISN